MTKEIKEVLESIENCIKMWRQGRKLGDETIIELLYLQNSFRLFSRKKSKAQKNGL